MTTSHNPARLRRFLAQLTQLVNEAPEEALLLERGKVLLHHLVQHDDWLPDAYAQPSPERYQQYLLYADPLERFSVVSFVWGPGQKTPVHNHTVWGLIGLLRGGEKSQGFAQNTEKQWHPQGAAHVLSLGDVEAVSPTIGDVHQVSNLFEDQTSISIHVYGANIGAVHRSVFTEDGKEKAFISGYSNTALPNIWDRSRETELHAATSH
ncbi:MULTISPECIES: cysteine dioxygenase family protein [Comamonas]|jgi:predicted metal-dependent enzyme (double-stranded beta helix superfamily)|uniref:Predicted metal-dependent enzyme of the double-stranded beta helix superfamily n=1 Tax=Comamonas testosteroni TaxID=285 RepID=A0A8B4S590_COMTE|nr:MULTISPECIES: cysteine dioxygenase [Comamonas]EHN63578.1 cysteine dioxygenase type I [Comamonas testosteroni ATCC 11996]QQN68123.1 cysteine dioxygenase [Comamonas testosteroni]RDI04674.1 putative metal-dependent enzyme (double-stranded beta helix superfamily) [Comamonas sp. AG1104]SUY78649.1 Predicted metal-dependent enzyme of the double-stranded beta helix superfamily [Comamonas testosteroni]